MPRPVLSILSYNWGISSSISPVGHTKRPRQYLYFSLTSLSLQTRDLSKHFGKMNSQHTPNAAGVHKKLFGPGWVQGQSPKISTNRKVFRAWKQLILECYILREYPKISNPCFEKYHGRLSIGREILLF